MAIGKPAVNANGLGERTWCTCPSRRVGQHLSDFLEGPNLGAVMPLQERDAARVIVVNVCGDDQVEVGDAVGELVLTNVCSHGTALLRYRTGLRARLDWNPRPPFGALPRLILCP